MITFPLAREDRQALDLLHTRAVFGLDDALDDAQLTLSRTLDDEVERFNRVGWPAEKAYLWAALEWWVTAEDVCDMGRWIMQDAQVNGWTRAEAARVVARMLEGWLWRVSHG